MIAKVIPIKKPIYYKLLDYIVNDKDRLFDAKGRSFLIAHNVKGNTIQHWVKQFKENETYRKIKKTNSVLLYHEIINFHKEDNVTLDILEDIVRQYIQMRNPKGMYVAVPHFDTQPHIHLAMSGLEYHTGNAMRMSKTELSQLQQGIQSYQKQNYPQLVHSIVNYGRKKGKALSDREWQMKQRTGRATQKESLQKIMELAYTRAKSPKDFFELLKKSGAETYVRGGKVSGVVWKGRKFRFKKIGMSIEKINELSRENILNKVRERKEQKREI